MNAFCHISSDITCYKTLKEQRFEIFFTFAGNKGTIPKVDGITKLLNNLTLSTCSHHYINLLVLNLLIYKKK